MQERTGHVCEFPDGAMGVAWVNALEAAHISDQWDDFWRCLAKHGSAGGGYSCEPDAHPPRWIKAMYSALENSANDKHVVVAFDREQFAAWKLEEQKRIAWESAKSVCSGCCKWISNREFLKKDSIHFRRECSPLPMWLRNYHAKKRKEKLMEMRVEDFKPAYPELLPALTDEEFQALKDDIELRGVLVSVEIDTATNEIVDGFHRHKAAAELGILDKIPIHRRQFKSEVERKLHALSLNVHRRQLSPSQRAAYAVEMLPLFEKHAKERQLAGLKKGNESPVVEKVSPRGKARDEAAEVFQTNPKYVSDAKRIKEEDPEKFQELKDGTKTISQVTRELRGGELLARTGPNGPYPRNMGQATTWVKWSLKAAINRIEAVIKAETREASHADYVAIGEFLEKRGKQMKSIEESLRSKDALGNS